MGEGSYLKRWICTGESPHSIGRLGLKCALLSHFKTMALNVCQLKSWGLFNGLSQLKYLLDPFEHWDGFGVGFSGWGFGGGKLFVFLTSLHRCPRQVPGNTRECWCSPRAFPAPSYLPRGGNLLFSCSLALFLPRAKLMLKVGHKGDRTIK